MVLFVGGLNSPVLYYRTNKDENPGPVEFRLGSPIAELPLLLVGRLRIITVLLHVYLLRYNIGLSSLFVVGTMVRSC